MSLIILENEDMCIEICNPKDFDDVHFHTRFSHCGYITQIVNKKSGKALFGCAVDKFHPFHGEGFPDEFEIPLLYKNIAVGENFVKIGVGLEKKLSQTPYTNWDEHPIVKKAETEVAQSGNAVSFVQRLEYAGVGYEYVKTIALGKTEYSISHSLKNTGTLAWTTLWYSHAFLPLGGSGSTVTLSKNTGGVLRTPSSNLVEMDDEAELFISDLTTQGECFQWDIECVDNFQKVYIANGECILDAIGDYQYQELQVYVNDRIISVEPKLNIQLGAGEQKCWKTVYKYS